MTNRGAVCMGNPLVRFWEGQEYDWYMEEILWHRRENRRQTEKDGSRPPATGLQEQVANRRKRLWSRAMVVSVTEKVL
ncbi:MAG: hypothetical protein ACYS3S_05945 [Planctomycetota bacterium]|jgi:hypothetical protein